MTFKAQITLKYDSKSFFGGDEFLPEEHVNITFPSHDLNTIQIFSAFRKFLLATGYTDCSISTGALSLAFSDEFSTEQMRKSAEEYDLILSEDHYNKIVELESEISSLKAKLSRLEKPENPQYTDEEMNAMCSHTEKQITKETLQSAYQVCSDCGSNYGIYKGGVSSWWTDKCDVCDKNDVPVTEARDFKYLEKGIQQLSK